LPSRGNYSYTRGRKKGGGTPRLGAASKGVRKTYGENSLEGNGGEKKKL